MDPTAVSSRAALVSGSRYELLVKIATGGTSTVYVGRIRGSEGFSRLVAIKRAHPHLRDDPDARRMLVREATLASRIHHANVVPIQDVEDDDEELLLVMSYVEGGTLAELLEAASAEGREPLSREVSLRLVLDACAGLSAVHSVSDDRGRPLGLVHRDVSPQNVLVGLDGTARLTDFGLAKLTEVSMSSTAGVQGKVAYLAPEYVEGQPYRQASDLFSLGVVAWETLSGQRLFRGKSDADTLRRVVGEEAPRLSSVREGYGEALDEVLARALDKRPERRPRSVDELSRAIVAAARPIVPATPLEVGDAVRRLLSPAIERRREIIVATANPEQASTVSMLHQDLPIPSVAQDEVSSAQAVVEPTVPLDPRLLRDHPSVEDAPSEEAMGEAETERMTAPRRDGWPLGPLALVATLMTIAAVGAVMIPGPEPRPLTADAMLPRLEPSVSAEEAAEEEPADRRPRDRAAEEASSEAQAQPLAAPEPSVRPSAAVAPRSMPRPSQPAAPAPKELPSNPYRGR